MPALRLPTAKRLTDTRLATGGQARSRCPAARAAIAARRRGPRPKPPPLRSAVRHGRPPRPLRGPARRAPSPHAVEPERSGVSPGIRDRRPGSSRARDTTCADAPEGARARFPGSRLSTWRRRRASRGPVTEDPPVTRAAGAFSPELRGTRSAARVTTRFTSTACEHPAEGGDAPSGADRFLSAPGYKLLDRPRFRGHAGAGMADLRPRRGLRRPAAAARGGRSPILPGEDPPLRRAQHLVPPDRRTASGHDRHRSGHHSLRPGRPDPGDG